MFAHQKFVPFFVDCRAREIKDRCVLPTRPPASRSTGHVRIGDFRQHGWKADSRSKSSKSEYSDKMAAVFTLNRNRYSDFRRRRCSTKATTSPAPKIDKVLGSGTLPLCVPLVPTGRY